MRTINLVALSALVLGVLCGTMACSREQAAPDPECPDWFREYAEDEWAKEDASFECVWDGRPEFVPVHRGLVRAIAYPAMEGDVVHDRIFVGFTAHHFELLHGKKYVELRTFGQPEEVESKYAGEAEVVGNTATLELEAKELLERGYGQFGISFVTKRPILEEERKLLAAPQRPLNYDLAVSFEEVGERLVLAMEDPRVHLFYFHIAYKGQGEEAESVPHCVDKWYRPDGSTRRVVVTRLTWEEALR